METAIPSWQLKMPRNLLGENHQIVVSDREVEIIRTTAQGSILKPPPFTHPGPYDADVRAKYPKQGKKKRYKKTQ